MQDNLKEQGEGECYRCNLTLFGPKFGQKLQFFWLPKYVRGIMEAEGRVEQETMYRDLRGRGKRAAEGGE